VPGTYRSTMTGCGDLIRLRLAKAATALPGRAPRTGHPVAWRFPELEPFPIRSAVRTPPASEPSPGRVAKRAFAFIIGTALLMVCTPLLLVVVVWLCGGRPVLFRPIRVTRASGLMQITKFRATTAQNPYADWTVSRGQGTSLSRLSRSTHLDDLSQFLNVIWRQMSLVGPAP
jgi:lipopolysaccharide/colanic/teichoic acid biosynthesis glycosyltransferase